VGRAKEAMMEQQDQRWSYTDSWVCSDCVDDGALEQAITAGADPDEERTFCGQKPAAPLDTLMAAFVQGVKREYDHALDVLYIDGGEFQGPTVDTYDLVHDEFLS